MSRLSACPSVMATLPHALSRLALAVLLPVMLLFTGCGAMLAQNPSGALRPVNAASDGEDSRVMLKGADVVAYFTMNRYVQGTPQFSSVYEGVTFRFANAEHKRLFDAAPAKYLPQYGGYCANGVVYGIPWGGDADSWRMDDGKLYIFGGRGSKDAYELDVAGNRKLADHYWTTEVAGSNSFIQRAKRLTFKVPHYKSGDELAAMVKAARGGTR